MDNPILIRAQEVGRTAFGDPRLVKRGQNCTSPSVPIQLWTRAPEHADKHERNYSKLPIEDKESYKWLASAERSKRCFESGEAQWVMQSAQTLTHRLFQTCVYIVGSCASTKR
jgi:hypothetical protein